MIKTKRYTIRQGDTDDIPLLIELGRKMHKESPRFRNMDYSEAKLIQLGKAVADQGGMFIAEYDGQITGMMIGMVTEHFFGYDLMAMDFVFYVDQDHRGGTIGLRLIKKFEAWAKALGARVITLGISTEIEAKRTGELYRRFGYRDAGEIFVKETGL